jgi:hypothetical protein
MEDRGLAASTIDRRLSAVCGFYRFAHIDGRIPSNPAQYVRRPQVHPSNTRGLDRSELGVFLFTSERCDREHAALAALVGLNGLRVSEACATNVEDLGLAATAPSRSWASVDRRSCGCSRRSRRVWRSWGLAGRQRVVEVVMEATGPYWKPIWYVLEDRDVALKLVNAKHVKMVPGRKTDMADAAWLAELLEHGLLRGSFVPEPAIRELRDLTRYRKRLIQTHTAE